MIYMTRTRNEGLLSIKKVEEDKMNKMTIRKKTMLLVAAGMAMQSMGLTAYAKEITEPTDFTSTVKQTQSKEDVLADAILQAQDAVKSKKAFLVVVASDASDNTKKMFSDMCTFYKVPIAFYSDKVSLGHAIGKEFRASLAVLDEGFGKQIQKHLEIGME